MIKYYCDICKKDITGERKYKLQMRSMIEFLEKEETICKDCMTRINTYIDKTLRRK